ncbi:MAG: hypothetical protein A3A86_02735 [Elusimicrobia bacterium RIFCSPLOWO2_01_FULL_60_11]|nr:MAG: hypothetical protein A3A86_02735 [Elusimicrobia bacterium RIFCSPLOWO2_01_FULL_60_11]
MTDPLIEVSELSYRAGEREILSGVSFKVERGDFLSIIGPNGAGKTTLLKCVGGILKRTKGSVRISGRPAESLSHKEMALRCAYVPQSGLTAFPFTVGEFVRMGRYAHTGPFSALSSGDLTAVRRAMQMTEIEEFEDRNLNTLSGGERQRVWIAAAVAQESEILLLDEPSTFLDPKHQIYIMEILKALNSKYGVTILSVTHDVNGALVAGGRAIALRDGKVAFSGAVQELLAGKVLEGIYGVPFHVLEHPHIGKRVAAHAGTEA